MAIIACPRCGGRGWMPKLTQAWRAALGAEKVVDISVARFGGVKDTCPRCLGKRRVLTDNPYYGKQRKK
jgi:hypothetical protein